MDNSTSAASGGLSGVNSYVAPWAAFLYSNGIISLDRLGASGLQISLSGSSSVQNSSPVNVTPINAQSQPNLITGSSQLGLPNLANSTLLPTTSNPTAGIDSLTGNGSNTSLVGTSTHSTPITNCQTPPTPSPVTPPLALSPFTILAEGTITANGNGDFDGEPANPSDDALIYAGSGFTLNGNQTLPVKRDANGNPIRDRNGKLVLVDRAVAVAPGYGISNASSNQYSNLVPPQVVDRQTVAVPAYTDIKQQDLDRRIPVGTATVTFNAAQNPLNTAADWTRKFPAAGTAARPTVVRVTGGGLTIPANVTLSNTVILVDQGDVNFNGSGHSFSNVAIVAGNGTLNLNNLRATDLSAFAAGSISMNGSARFGGFTLLANGNRNGSITFNGATSAIDPTQNLKVIAQGDITFNGAADTRGAFLTAKNFTFNGKSTLLGTIGAKGNILFNCNATVIAATIRDPDVIAPIITAQLLRDTAIGGTTNSDRLTSDPTIVGTVTDLSTVAELRAGFNNTPTANHLNILSDRQPDGSFNLSRARLNQIFGSTLPDGAHVLHLQAKDQYGNTSSFDFSFTFDTAIATPSGLQLAPGSDSGQSNQDQVTQINTPTITGRAEPETLVQLYSGSQFVGNAATAANGTWQITTQLLSNGNHTLQAVAIDLAGNVSPVSSPLNIAVDAVKPQLSLTTPIANPLKNGAKLTGTISGTGSSITLLTYRFDNKAETPLSFNATTGAFDQALDFAGIGDGSHTLTITATDLAGNTTVAPYSVTVIIDRTAPVIAAKLVRDTAAGGTTNSDRLTFDPSITGSVSDASQVVSFRAGFDAATPNQFVDVIAKRQTDGSFSFDRAQLNTIYGSPLLDGAHTLKLQAKDEFGNLSEVFTLAFTLDTTPPTAPSLDLPASSDTGSSDSDNITRTNTPAIAGTSEAGSSVQLYREGVLVGETTSNGNWQIVSSQLADGTYRFTAKAIDAAGNISDVLSPLAVTIDRTAPQLSLTKTIDVAPLQQNARLQGNTDGTGTAIAAVSYRFNNGREIPVALTSNGSFDQAIDFTGISNGTYTLTLTTTDIAGNVTTAAYNVGVAQDFAAPTIAAGLVRDTAPGNTTNTDKITFNPSISGLVIDASAVASFKAKFNTAASFTDVLAARQADGHFSFDRAQLEAIYGGLLPDGAHTLYLQAADSFGNLSAVFGITFTLDTTAPVTVFDLDPSFDTTPVGDRQTVEEMVTLVGQTEAKAIVWLQQTNTTVTADATGRFTFSGVPLDLGTNLFSVRSTDQAGNESVATQTIIRQPRDTTAPTIAAALVNDTAISGTNTDQITADPTIAGTITDMSRVSEFRAGFDATAIANFTNVLPRLQPNGSFSFSRSQLEAIYGGTIPDGAHTLQLQAKDEYGNLSGVFEFNFILDTIAPIAPAFNLHAASDTGAVGDFKTGTDTVTLVGQTEANAAVTLAQTGATTTADATGRFTFGGIALAIGSNSFRVNAIDAAGNQSNFSTTITRLSPPIALSLSNRTVAENSAGGTVIGQLSTSDPDLGDSHVYTLVDNAGGRFQIVGDRLQVKPGAVLDFETTSSYEIEVRSTDADGLSKTQRFAIALTNVNEAPTFTSTPILLAQEGTNYRYTIVTTDPDSGDSRIISANSLPKELTLVDNGDGTASLYGQLKLGNYDVSLSVQDAAGLTAVQSFTLKAVVSMTEQQHFAVERSVALTIPQSPSTLSFKIAPTFDTQTVNFINDAVEVALVDEQGRSIVHTIGEGRDAFFNWSEGEAKALGAGASYDTATGTVKLNLTGITPETVATLVFRLVNDDQDTATGVQIENLVIGTAPAGTLPPVSSGGLDRLTAQSNTRLDFSHLQDVSNSFRAEYYQTSLNAKSKLLYTDVAIRNIGNYSTNAPLVVAIKHISDPSVQVRDIDGFTPEGSPYYDFSRFVQNGKLSAAQLTDKQSIVFYNPNGVQFSYDLVVLAQLNDAPEIKTQAVTEVIGGQTYHYNVDAIDRNGDTLSYQLLAAPEGMAIDPQTGEISWKTMSVSLGSYVVSVAVTDSRGGSDQQTFNISVVEAPPNRPPLFTSIPTVDARVNTPYIYQASATDVDNDALQFTLVSAPAGMQIEPTTGIIRWTPNGAQLGIQSVVLSVTDGKGGTAIQRFKIQTQIEVGNHAPLITSNPITIAHSSTEYTYSVRAVDPDEDTLVYSLLNSPTGMKINAQTGAISWKNPQISATLYDVTVKVEDNRGGVSTQSYQLQVPSTTQGEIQGTVWGDANANGLQDPGELGLVGATVYLDLNANQGLDSNEYTVTTDYNGQYKFEGLEAGTYTVREVLPDGFSYTFPSGSLLLGDNIVQNGSFEQGLPTTYWFPVSAGSTNISFWNVKLSSVDYCSTGLWQASDGRISLDLDGSPGPGGVTQFINTVPGQTYSVTFDLSAHGFLYAGTARTATVSAAGQSAEFIGIAGNTSNMNYKPQQWQFRADSTTTELGFYSYRGDSYGPVLDNVKVCPILGTNDRRQVVSLAAGQVASNQNFGNQLIGNGSINHAPDFNTIALSTEATVGQTWRYQAQATDSDFDALTYDLLVAPEGMIIDAKTGLVAWKPTPEQAQGSNSTYLNAGTYTVLLRVRDGQGGVDVQSFEITARSTQQPPVLIPGSSPLVSHQGANHAPAITSTPNLVTNLEREYRYNLSGFDSDGDSLLWTLDAAPVGMVVDPTTGVLHWQPRADQVGQHQVSVRLVDVLGSYVEQTFTLQVNGTTLAPSIYSSPTTSAVQGQAYTYTVVASDPENDALTFALGNHPIGMTIDSSGLVRWIPQANQLGAQSVEVLVTDAQGAIGSQTFSVQVGNTATNRSPKITSTPTFLTAASQPYRYQVQATDPDAGDTLSYRLLEHPNGMVIDATTGQVTWTTPPVGQHRVVVGVEDSRGLGTAQSFTLTARDNHAPVVQSTPTTTATAKVPYRYDLRVVDPEGDRLAYSLNSASIAKGMKLDVLGRLQWTPTIEQVGTHSIQLAITDGLGATTQQAFDLTVLADTAAPQVQLTATQTAVTPGSELIFQAVATDNVGVKSLQLLVNGESYALDARGLATVTVKQDWTAIVAEAIAKDAAGNSGRAETSVRVSSLNNHAPIVDLDLSGIVNGTITAPTDIIGSVSDPDNDRLTYKLEVAPVAGGEFKTLFEGDRAVAHAALGKFDPSLLLNDAYTLRLSAIDEFGNATAIEDTLNVTGELKLGNFRLSFTDLAIPVTGIPITLTRTYDTLTSSTSDDFGYGWRMEFRDTDLRTSLKRNKQLEELGSYSAFKDGTKVFITLPGGKREAFTFKPKGAPFNYILAGYGTAGQSAAMYTPAFVSDKDVTSTLSVKNADATYLKRNGNTSEYDSVNGSAYNPADPTFGGVYVLTTKEGTVYEIDGKTGDLLKVSDTNGNSLSYSDDAIASSTGQKITFERDAQGRITSVKDPMGELIRYSYDAQGDLVSVSDQEKNETKFIYDLQHAHYLKEIIDPLKRTAARTDYDENGRLKQVANGANTPIAIEYKPEESIQIVKDVYGNPTVYRYDDRGNVLEVKNALGYSTFFEYDANNNLTLTKDANHLVTKYEYGDRGNLKSKTEAYCGCPGVVPGTTYYTYYTFGQMQDLILPTGASMHLNYDARGNLLTMTDGKGSVIQSFTYYTNGLVKSETDTSGTTRYEYDGLGNAIKTIDADGKITSMEYFATGLLKSMVEDNGTPNDLSDDQTSSFTYDKLGREQKADYGNGIWVEYGYQGSGGDWMTLDAPTIGHIERKLTDDGKLAGWVTASGGTPSFYYDQAGRLWRETDESGNVTTEYGYDAIGRVTSLKDVRTGAVTTKTYDAGNRVTEEIDSLGGFTRYEYDIPRNGGKLKSVTRGQLLKDGNGNWIVDTMVAPQTTRFEYNGTRTTVIDSLGRRTTSVIDEYSLPIETVFEARNGKDYSTKTSYLYQSNLQEAKDYPTRTVDIGGNDRAYTYDELGRLKTATDLGNSVYSYSYGDHGLSQITSPTGETLKYGYDAVMGNLTSVTYGDGTTKQMSYRPQDNRLGTVTLQSGETIAYTYDTAGRTQSQITKSANGTITGTVSYTYTANGSMDLVTDDKAGTTDYDYDSSTGALSRITYGNGSSIAYTYDLFGRTKTVTEKASAIGSSYTTTYDYDTFGNLKSVLDPAGGLTTMKYDVGNRLIERSLPNGVKSVYQYDDLDRVKSITHTNAQGTVLASVAYDRNGIGEPTKITREDNTYVTLKYDEALRVKEESYYSATGTLQETIAYTYDAAGKRTAKSDRTGTDTYNYKPGFQLDSITGTSGTEDYEFDANGRLTLIERDGVTIDLTHDAGDRLTSVANITTGETTQYVYDGQRNRVGAIEGSEVRQFLVAPGMGSGLNSTDLIADGNGNLLSNYIYAGGSSPFMRLDASGNPVYYLTDAIGTTIGLANRSGTEVGDFRYDSFGNLREAWGGAIGSAGGDFRFQGQWLEENTGIYYFRARDYDAQTGMFLSRDPVDPTEQQPESLNPYQFAYNNSYLYRDPTGMFSILELNAAEAVQKGIDAAQQAAYNQLRSDLIDKAKGITGQIFQGLLSKLFPFGSQSSQLLNTLLEKDTATQGSKYENMLTFNICEVVGGGFSQYLNYLWFEPSVEANGTPIRDGYGCELSLPVGLGPVSDGVAHPDYIIKSGGPATTDYAKRSVYQKAYLIGDVARTVGTVRNKVKSGKAANQTNAIINYAATPNNHQYTPIGLYITLFGGSQSDVAAIAKRGITKGVALLVAPLFPNQDG